MTAVELLQGGLALAFASCVGLAFLKWRAYRKWQRARRRLEDLIAGRRPR
jgi:hypothetical protein